MKVKSKRKMAGILAAVLIALVLLAFDCINGDPISERWAMHRAIQFAEKLYPDQTFTAENAGSMRGFCYTVGVQSQQSRDTRFYVETSFWLFTSDTHTVDHTQYVDARLNTAWRMNEWHGIKTIFSRKVWMGVAQFLITMVSTVVFDLTVAIVIGIVTALLMFVWNAARLTIETEPVDKVRLERLHRMGKPVDESRAKSILVSYVNGSLFFANCAELKRKLLSVDFTGCEHLILSLRGVSATDISGVQTLMEVCALIAQKGVTVSICGVHENVAGFFQKVGLTDQLGAAAFYPNASEAVIDTLAQEQAGA